MYKRQVYILDWRTQTKIYLINVGARNLVIYIKMLNSVALFLGDMFEKCLRSTVLSRPSSSPDFGSRRRRLYSRYHRLHQVPCRVPVTTGPANGRPESIAWMLPWEVKQCRLRSMQILTNPVDGRPLPDPILLLILLSFGSPLLVRSLHNLP